MVFTLKDGWQVRIAPGRGGKGIAVVPLGPGAAEPPKRRQSSTGGTPGRKPRPGTVLLRRRLEQDRQAGKARPAGHYIKWITGKDKGLDLPVARTIVYRELKRVGQIR